MQNKNSVAAALQGKCPHCRTGSMFVHPVSKLGSFMKMNERCPHCQVRLEPEPGFYQGAMYVSYAFTVLFMGVIWAILYYLAGDPSEWVYIGIVIATMILVAPLNYRFSRILYLYWFGGIKYDPSLSR